MVWDPVRGIKLRPLKPTTSPSVANDRNVMLADYETEVDQEIANLYQQMERLEERIRNLKSRSANVSDSPQRLRPVYRPEQPLRPIDGTRPR